MKKDQKKYTIVAIIFLLALSIIALLLYPKVEKIIRCPDQWHINDSFDARPGLEREGFFKGGEKVILSSEEKQWIKDNCGLKSIKSS